MKLIHKMVMLGDESELRGWSIEVTDESNRSLFIVLFPQISRFRSKDNSIRQSGRLVAQ